MKVSYLLFLVIYITTTESHRKYKPNNNNRKPKKKIFRRVGHVAHGFNNFNGNQIYDWTSVSNRGGVAAGCTVASLTSDTDSGPSQLITETTLRTNILATCPTGRDVPEKFLSIPVLNVGTLDTSSTDHTVRIPVKDFKDGQSIGDTRIDKDGIFRPTVGDYDKMTGKLKVDCTDDSHSTVKITINDGIPKMLYTVWEIALFKPLTDNELLDGFAPVLPNIIKTDKNGDGSIEFELPYCPYNSCKSLKQCACEDNCTTPPDCDAFYFIAAHWDYCVYGGTSAWEGTPQRLPGGTITAFQYYLPLSDNIRLVQN